MKIRLSELRRLIREELKRDRLLREADDLSGRSLSLVGRLEAINRDLRDVGVEVGVKLSARGHGAIRLKFEVRPVGDSPREHPQSKKLDDMGVPQGHITVGPPIGDGKCSGAWIVWSVAPTTHGWGPLLYDLAMELATREGGGLTSDRTTVTPAAQAVWDKYDKARPDVEPVQLDWLDGKPEEKLTPDDESDDCVQKIVFDTLGKDRRDWSSSPMSRAYRKPDAAVTTALDAAGLLWR